MNLILNLSGVALLATSLLAQAATVTGNVVDKTTNKPSVGDDVVLISLQQGMQEAADGRLVVNDQNARSLFGRLPPPFPYPPPPAAAGTLSSCRHVPRWPRGSILHAPPQTGGIWKDPNPCR